MITIALPKGRILEETLPLLKRAGVELLDDPEKTRKLILQTTRDDVRIVIVRASDVPTYVGLGAADLGVSGWDTLMEHGMEGLYSLLDLHISKCRVCVAAPQGFDYAAKVKQGNRLRVATKYVETTRKHFAAKGVHIDVVKLYGSMELAPLTGLADVIVDFSGVPSGATIILYNDAPAPMPAPITAPFSDAVSLNFAAFSFLAMRPMSEAKYGSVKSIVCLRSSVIVIDEASMSRSPCASALKMPSHGVLTNFTSMPLRG